MPGGVERVLSTEISTEFEIASFAAVLKMGHFTGPRKPNNTQRCMRQMETCVCLGWMEYSWLVNVGRDSNLCFVCIVFQDIGPRKGKFSRQRMSGREKRNLNFPLALFLHRLLAKLIRRYHTDHPEVAKRKHGLMQERCCRHWRKCFSRVALSILRTGASFLWSVLEGR